MKLEDHVKTELLYRLREVIDRGRERSAIQLLDEHGRVVVRMFLKRPCAADPREGALVFHEFNAMFRPEIPGIITAAKIVNGNGEDVMHLTVGTSSAAEVCLKTLNVSASDLISPEQRLIVSW